jgi:5-methylcytosine-specific restriction endonuclease McrA
MTRWRLEHPEFKEQERVYLEKYYVRNREAMLERSRLYAAMFPEAAKARVRNRQARKRGAEGSHTANDISAIRKAQKDRCAYCKVKLRGLGDIDHIVALSNGGTNWPSNLQLACPSCNRRKRAKCPQKFARELGMLL